MTTTEKFPRYHHLIETSPPLLTDYFPAFLFQIFRLALTQFSETLSLFTNAYLVSFSHMVSVKAYFPSLPSKKNRQSKRSAKLCSFIAYWHFVRHTSLILSASATVSNFSRIMETISSGVLRIVNSAFISRAS